MTLFDFLFTRVNFHDCYFPPLQMPSSLPSMITVSDAEGSGNNSTRLLRSQVVTSSCLLRVFQGFRAGSWSGSEFEPVRLDSRTGMLHGAREREFLFFTLFFYIYALKNLQANFLCSIQSISFQLLNSTVFFLIINLK